MKTNFLNKIYSNSNKMSYLIDKLRLTLKLEEGKQGIVKKNCSIRYLCEDISTDLKQKYKNQKIEIEGEDINLKVDEALFSMSLSNLIENALKYSENDIKIKLTKGSISVVDKGIGISEDDLSKIGKKFYRVSKNGWNNSLGLGLFIVYSILKLHDFKLDIYSKKDLGSEFIIKY